MQLTACEIAGYRSLRAVRLPLGTVSVLLGENGAGKTNILTSLQLLQAAATGPICRMLVDEGGLSRVLWAGRLPPGEGSAPTSLRLIAHFANLRYAIEIGQPGKGDAASLASPSSKRKRSRTPASAPAAAASVSSCSARARASACAMPRASASI
jgi:predicted ATPase